MWYLKGLLIVAGAFFLQAPKASGFLLENGDFDDPIDFEDGLGWERFGDPGGAAAVGRFDAANGGPGNPFYSQVGDGNYGLAFLTETAVSGGFYQDVRVEAGRTYDFSIQSHHACNSFGSSGTNDTELVLHWYDDNPAEGGTLVSTVINNMTPSSPGGCDGEFPSAEFSFDWNDWTFTEITPPAGASYLRVQVQWINVDLAVGGSAWIRWDNARLSTSLDPINLVESNEPVGRLTHSTQAGMTHTILSAPDLMTFDDAGLAPVAGDGSDRVIHFLTQGSRKFYRVSAITNGLDTPQKVRAADVAGGNMGWEGFMNVFELPELGGGFVFNGDWGVDNLVSTVSSTTNEVGSILTLSPNTIEDPNKFWYQNTSGTAADPENPGGPGQRGNKTMEANLFITHTDSSLSGQTVTFTGTVLSNTLTNDHIVVAFIKDFAPDFSSNIIAFEPLPENGPFSITLATDPGAGRHIQIGFSMTGENVWITDVGPFGNVQIAVEPFVFDSPTATLDSAMANVISWDGQVGVRYVPEYSDNAGSSWHPLFVNVVVGTGGREKRADPTGEPINRLYRIGIEGF